MSTLYLTKQAKIYNGVKADSSINGTGKTGQLMLKNKIRTLPNTMYKTKLKVEDRLKYKDQKL